MSISQNFPNTRPSLNLNFARSKTLDPRITFTRSQTGNEASYVDEDGLIKYASADEPRFDHDPVTGECLGLIIEEQRSNLVTYSSDMSQWSANGTPIYADNDTTAPDGTLTADKLTGGGNVFDGRLINVTGITTGNNYVISTFIKPVGVDQPITRVGLWNNNGGSSFWFANVDTSWNANGEPTTSSSSESANDIKYQSYPNDWYRISFNFNASSYTGGTIEFHQHPDRAGFGKSAYFWGAQLERDDDYVPSSPYIRLGGDPSSYIPTSGSTVTRNSDNVWMDDITDFFNPNEGTAIITYRPRFNGAYNTPFQSLFRIRNTTTTRSIGFTGNTNNSQLYFSDYAALLGEFTWMTPPAPSTQRSERVLVSYANTYFRMYENERPFSSTSSIYGAGKISEYFPSLVGISTLGFNALIFGTYATGNTNEKFNYTLQQFIYYPSEVGVSNAKTLSKRP